MKNSKQSLFIWILLAVSSLGLVVAFILFRNSRKKEQEPEQEQEADHDLIHEAPDLDLIPLYKMIRERVDLESRIEQKDIASKLLTAQAIVEASDNYNAFSLKHPAGVRKTTSKGADDEGFATYSSYEESIEDRLLYDEYNNISYEGMNVVSFCQKMNELKYFEGRFKFLNYKNELQKAFNELISQLNNG
jgi:hypothetical protein